MRQLSKTLIALLVVLAGCVRVPDNVVPVDGFQADRYLGTWYEIARLDHSFERGLDNVTATYSWRDDGGLRVLNRGYDADRDEWKEIEGKAYFVGEPGVGRLKVSFFGPFYGGYNIIALDKEEYGYALVSGPTRSYLWILARTPMLDAATRERLVAEAQTMGFATEALIYVKHDLYVPD